MITNTHSFNLRCIDFAAILRHTTLDDMLKEVHEQSKSEEAKIRVDVANYKDYGTDQWCPLYFGMFSEWLACHFLNHYGRLWNVQSITMTDSVGSTHEDYGIDGMGFSIDRKEDKASGRIIVPNSPVYLQVKGTLNPRKEYSPNDGSRLPNFGCNAMATALKTGYAYQSRFLLFTTGKGISYTLDKMFMGLIEVIARKQISKLMDNNAVFLNQMRVSVGLPPVPIASSAPDSEFVTTGMLLSELAD